jgi:hypothetical protein
MDRRHLIGLLALNAVGGIAVLASYVDGLLGDTAVGNALWGGIPEALRPLYTVNMFLAAAGYFLFTPYIAFRLSRAGSQALGRVDFRWFYLLYALVLLPSALWLPLTAEMVSAPSSGLWLAIRIDLALVGLGALGLLAALASLPADAPKGRRLAMLGLLPFCLQTAVLDAAIWPAYYPLPSA